ncbi:amidase domain-containing protein [Aneurinibacillus terranovensis]|uniref:amidase domain-containing protein n=1 Tax=Aneurinibacillus terranovensis TaxID=278991 RepID=UPI0003FD8A9F|nr:amidase domain-containing protein [Aneurinibacillus terranovensis]
MANWNEVLEKYFYHKTRLLIENDDGIFSVMGGHTRKQILEQYGRIHRQQRERNIIPLKSRIDIKRLAVEKSHPDEVVVHVTGIESYIYRLGRHIYEQAKESIQRITLHKQEDTWLIWFDQRIRPTYEKEPAATIEDAEVSSKQTNYPFQMTQNMLGGFTEEPLSEERQYSYDRIQAVRYAEIWWNDYNPRFHTFEVDCTNFISQCLYAGGVPMSMTGKRNSGWWYRQSGTANESWSYSWAVAHSLRWVLEHGKYMRTERKVSAVELSVGDVICYDFDGDGHWQHNTIVVAKDYNGMPLVNAHTTNSRHRYWDYHDSSAYTPQIQYRFFHLLS